MRAVTYTSVGSPDVIQVSKIDKPEPGLFEIRIKVQAASLNPADMAAWSGLFPPPAEGSQFGLGWDIAGVVDAVGPGATWEVGTPVIAIIPAQRAWAAPRPSTRWFLAMHSPMRLPGLIRSRLPPFRSTA